MADTAARILILLLACNAAPILAARLLGSVADWPLDAGRKMADGSPLLGSSKTWRGVAAALLVACSGAVYLGFDAFFGLAFGALVMVGDVFSSFVKRRRGLAASDQSLGLDQLPESAFPAIYAVLVTGLAWWWMLVLPLVFMVLELLISRPLYWMKIRKRPY